MVQVRTNEAEDIQEDLDWVDVSVSVIKNARQQNTTSYPLHSLLERTLWFFSFTMN